MDHSIGIPITEKDLRDLVIGFLINKTLITENERPYLTGISKDNGNGAVAEFTFSPNTADMVIVPKNLWTN